MKAKTDTILQEFERGIKVVIADKFAEHSLWAERDPFLRGTEIGAIGKSMGESLVKPIEIIEMPSQWQRFIKTKRCPKYMKEIVRYDVKAYYPRISLPKEEHWVSFEKEGLDV